MHIDTCRGAKRRRQAAEARPPDQNASGRGVRVDLVAIDMAWPPVATARETVDPPRCAPCAQRAGGKQAKPSLPLTARFARAPVAHFARAPVAQGGEEVHDGLRRDVLVPA